MGGRCHGGRALSAVRRRPATFRPTTRRELHMADLVYTGFMSLDGVLDSPGGGSTEEHRSAGWVVSDIEFLPEAFSLKSEELESTTALMFGRRSYEVFAPVWRESDDHVVYRDLPKYVVSTTLSDDAIVEGWGPTTILRSTDDVAE